MKTLIEYINKSNISSKNLCDGHIHLFDRIGVLDNMCVCPETLYRIGFINVYLPQLSEYTNDVIDALYSDYIHYHKKKSDILLAAGQDSNGLIALYEKHKNDIKGFGELKCYDYYNGEPVTPGYKNIEWIQPLCDYITRNRLYTPIYIHWNLDSKVDELEKLIKKYPNIIFLICHCGMDNIIHSIYTKMTDSDNKQCLHTLISLTSKYPNVWTDISWAASDYFINHPQDLSKLDLSRVVVGSDCSPIGCVFTKDSQSLCDKYYKNLIKLNNDIDNENNIKRLFKL